MSDNPVTAQPPAKTLRKARAPARHPPKSAALLANLNDGDVIIKSADGLPSLHVRHSSNLVNRLSLFQSEFNNGFRMVEAEMRGQQHDYDEWVKQETDAFNKRLEDKAAKHAAIIAELERDRNDLSRGIAVLQGAMDAADRNPIPDAASDAPLDKVEDAS